MDKAVTPKKEPIGADKYIYVSPEHTFGTDAVLLADFAGAKTGDIAADLGTGCGIIPFLMLRDGRLGSVTGVDIAADAIDLANKTAAEQGFLKFRGIVSDICDLKGRLTFGDKTLVTCNPPYKKAGAGLKAEGDKRLIARQETTCTLEDIVEVSSRLLNFGGRLCMCQRPERLSELMSLMSRHGVEPKRLRLVCKTAESAPWLFLIEGRRGGKSGMLIEPTLCLYKNGELTDEMKRIYGPYKEAYL